MSKLVDYFQLKKRGRRDREKIVVSDLDETRYEIRLHQSKVVPLGV